MCVGRRRVGGDGRGALRFGPVRRQTGLRDSAGGKLRCSAPVLD